VAVNPVDPQIGGPHRLGRAVERRSTLPSLPQHDHVHAEDRAVDDLVDAAVAVVTVAAALARYAADAASRSRRRILRHLPFTAPPTVLRRGLPGPVAWAVAHPASAAVRALAVAADEFVPGVTRAVLARLDVPALVREFVDVDRLAAMLDVDAVVARVDLDAVLDRVDLDSIVARVDLDRAVSRVDLDAVLDRVDLDAIAARLDLDTLVDSVDVSRVIDRVDLDAIAARLDLDSLVDSVDVSRVIDRVDLDSIVARVDLDRAVNRVDLDRAVDRVDVDRVIARTDVAGLARYVVQVIDLPGLLRASTDSVSAEMARGVRDQGAEADRAVERVVDRLLHRPGRRTGPAT
jgi:hypothetical protein